MNFKKQFVEHQNNPFNLEWKYKWKYWTSRHILAVSEKCRSKILTSGSSGDAAAPVLVSMRTSAASTYCTYYKRHVGLEIPRLLFFFFSPSLRYEARKPAASWPRERRQRPYRQCWEVFALRIKTLKHDRNVVQLFDVNLWRARGRSGNRMWLFWLHALVKISLLRSKCEYLKIKRKVQHGLAHLFVVFLGLCASILKRLCLYVPQSSTCRSTPVLEQTHEPSRTAFLRGTQPFPIAANMQHTAHVCTLYVRAVNYKTQPSALADAKATRHRDLVHIHMHPSVCAKYNNNK